MISMEDLTPLFSNKVGEEFLNALHSVAIERGVSDLHFFPQKDKTILAWREDGIMVEVYDMPHALYADVMRRIKFASKLSLNITHIPQDGQYSFPDGDVMIKVRVSTMPARFGEALTLRLLDSRRGIVPLEKLGMQKDIEDDLQELVKNPNGIMLVTGPTGSGKTTTLYALLSTQIGKGKNIITLEDPIEYELPGILQSQIDHKKKYTFALGLRAILRQDPDVVLVGEIRDAETAKIAAEAALTGHMVFATLHTNSAIESIPRLLSMGVEPYLLAPAMRAVLAQRLIRKVVPGTENEYKGRTSLNELLVIDKGMRDLILANAEQKDLEAYAKKQGFRTMFERGEEYVKEGITTMEEIARVAS